MATDWWPSEEGIIVEGLTFFGYCEAAIAEGAPCKVGATTTAGRLQITTATGLGDAQLVALKKGAQYDTIPVAESGLMKMINDQDANISAGEFVMNSVEGGVATGESVTNSTKLALFGGTSYVLGMSLQTTTAKHDEIIVLLGKYL